MLMRENRFQRQLIQEIETRWPDAIVLKNDPGYIQGFPDLTILKDDKWACLETKRGSSAHKQPNQDIYISKLDSMSFGRFISPENKDEVLNDLQKTFGT